MFCQHDKRKDYCKICSNISKITKTEPVNIEMVEHYLNILFLYTCHVRHIYHTREIKTMNTNLSHEGNQNICILIKVIINSWRASCLAEFP